IISRLADRSDRQVCGIDQGELRGRVVVEEVLVMLTAERVPDLIAAALSFAAVGLLDAGTLRRYRLRRQRAHFLGHKFDQESFLVSHPLQFFVEHWVEPYSASAMDFAGRGGADAWSTVLGTEIDEPDSFPTRRPIRETWACACG